MSAVEKPIEEAKVPKVNPPKPYYEVVCYDERNAVNKFETFPKEHHDLMLYFVSQQLHVPENKKVAVRRWDA